MYLVLHPVIDCMQYQNYKQTPFKSNENTVLLFKSNIHLIQFNIKLMITVYFSL